MRFLHQKRNYSQTMTLLLGMNSIMMMPAGGLFLRRATAFVMSSGSSSNRVPKAAAAAAAGTRALFSGTTATPTRLAATSVTAAAASDSVTDIEKEAKSTLSIVGSSVTMDSFQGVPFLNTKDCSQFRVLFVLGGPGAGKGTQSALLLDNYPCVHLSAGELLRAETKKEDSPHKELIETCLVSGNIVPVEISLSLLENAMKEAAQQSGKELIFLVDGFPRNFDNLDGWIRCMSRSSDSDGGEGVASVWGVLNYQCPLEELERRILNRAKEGSGRSDDNLQSARKRFGTFQSETEPVVETLRRVERMLEDADQPSLRVFDIRADQSVEDVWKQTQRAMDRMISYDVLTAQSQLMHAIQTKDANLYRKVCADEWFEQDDGDDDDDDDGQKSVEEIMTMQEGGEGGAISNLKLSYISGTKVAIEYDRIMGDNNKKISEKRIWSHQGTQGWKNIHFARLPAAEQ